MTVMDKSIKPGSWRCQVPNEKEIARAGVETSDAHGKHGCLKAPEMMGVFASGKLEKGGSDSNTETFHRDPAG